MSFKLPRGSLARVVALFLALQAVALVLLGAEVRAHASEALAGIAHAAMRYPSADRQDGPRTLNVNGLRLRLSAGSTRDSPESVIGAFEARCRERSGVRWAPLDPALRFRYDDGEAVACIDLGEPNIAPTRLAERVARFAKTGDLSDVGEFRFVTARRGAAKTVFITIWSEGELDVSRAFAAEGDVPGRDLVGVSRPKGVRRVLYASEEGESPALFAYESIGGRLSCEMFEAAFLASGWERVCAPSDSPRRSSLFAKQGHQSVGLGCIDDQGARTIAILARF